MQDVGDVLTALDYAIDKGLVDASKVAVLGGSHGGFLTSHLVGQVHFAVIIFLILCPYLFLVDTLANHHTFLKDFCTS